LLDIFGTEHPIIQAPMAGYVGGCRLISRGSWIRSLWFTDAKAGPRGGGQDPVSDA
jgi:hypothetical protein